MADSPILYVRREAINVVKDGVAENRIGSWRFTPASPSEILSAARAHLDYSAAKRAYEGAPMPIRAEDFVRRIVDAALRDTEAGLQSRGVSDDDGVFHQRIPGKRPEIDPDAADRQLDPIREIVAITVAGPEETTQ